jgi:hypothetical protein
MMAMTAAIVEWFWRGAALEEARRSSPATPRAAEFVRLANSTAQLARRARDPFERDSSDAVACELYRQSVYWSLRALETSVTSQSTDSGDQQEPDLSALWRRADQVLLRAECAAEALDRFEHELLDASFSDFAARAPTDLARSAADAQSLSQTLIALIECPKARVLAAIRQRVVRVGALIGLPLVVWSALAIRSELNPYDRNLALGRPWRTSSTLFVGCVSPSQSCNPNSGFFFHTREELHPWLEIDLGEPQTFSAVRVLNRTDCCRERAVPLLVEVSNDRLSWQRVAEQAHDFAYWKASFPAVRARWVRVRSPRSTALHLRELLVLR